MSKASDIHNGRESEKALLRNGGFNAAVTAKIANSNSGGAGSSAAFGTFEKSSFK